MSPETRLQKILSAAGVASRRAAETLIVQGRVSVNGVTVRELGSRADPDRDDIRVDGRRIKIASRRLYLLLNKPRGYVTTRSDPQGRPTVLDLIKGIREYIYPVGRLDYDSEGLLILTNDGDLAARLTHPRHGVEREYEARVRGVPDRHAIDRLARGVVVDGRRTAPARVKLVTDMPASAKASARPRRSAGATERREGGRRGSDQAVLSITVREGRHRQIRKMCDAIGHPVVRLRRVRIGPIEDDRLEPGEYRELTRKELDLLSRPTPPSKTGSDSRHRARASADRPPRG